MLLQAQTQTQTPDPHLYCQTDVGIGVGPVLALPVNVRQVYSAPGMRVRDLLLFAFFTSSERQGLACWATGIAFPEQTLSLAGRLDRRCE